MATRRSHIARNPTPVTGPFAIGDQVRFDPTNRTAGGVGIICKFFTGTKVTKVKIERNNTTRRGKQAKKPVIQSIKTIQHLQQATNDRAEA